MAFDGAIWQRGQWRSGLAGRHSRGPGSVERSDRVGQLPQTHT